VFRFGGTTGGIDIVARIFNKIGGWSLGQIILVIDAAILLSGLIYLPKEKILYTLVSVFISTQVIDFIQEGAYAAKAFTIISERAGDIARAVTVEMERGVTLFPSRGAYSNREREVLYCVVSRQEVHKLKTLVRKIDPSAFMVISDVHDVLGEGFRAE
ncbi:YitT family protein, partial [Caldibacillus debilis]|uniref:YitT family protein n=1 Tax=Caldibacillus debilis TaxID=301148 RepID=UPI0023EFC78C